MYKAEFPTENNTKIFNITVNPEKEKLIEDGFKSHKDYLDHYKSGDKRGKSTLKKKIDNLKDSLKEEFGIDIDPIIYLIQLYYGDGLPIRDISEILSKRGWKNKHNTSLEKTFKITFGWILRDSTGSEVSTNKRKTNGQTREAVNNNIEEIEKKHKQINDYIKDKVQKILYDEVRHFSIEEFNKLDKPGKILYILNFKYGINAGDLKKLNEDKIGTGIIANNLNQNLKSFLEELGINFTINSRDIKEIINEN